MKQNFEVRIYNMDGSSPAEFSDTLTLSTKDVSEVTETVLSSSRIRLTMVMLTGHFSAILHLMFLKH